MFFEIRMHPSCYSYTCYNLLLWKKWRKEKIKSLSLFSIFHLLREGDLWQVHVLSYATNNRCGEALSKSKWNQIYSFSRCQYSYSVSIMSQNESFRYRKVWKEPIAMDYHKASKQMVRNLSVSFSFLSHVDFSKFDREFEGKYT